MTHIERRVRLINMMADANSHHATNDDPPATQNARSRADYQPINYRY